MFEESSQAAPATAARMGRPGIPEADHWRIFGHLALFAPKSDEFRRQRRAMAVKFDVTERRIEQIYAEIKERVGEEVEAAAAGRRPRS